jgi:OmpA-OmpF porin, OOP family
MHSGGKPIMKTNRHLVAAALLAGVGLALAAAGDQPVKPLPGSAAPAASSVAGTLTTSLPARGLFVGDQLTAAARQKLGDLAAGAAGQRVEVALLVPTGPWKIDGSGTNERDLTPARLQSVKRFLAERGFDPKHIYVESRVDNKIQEPRLDVQIVTRPADL